MKRRIFLLLLVFCSIIAVSVLAETPKKNYTQEFLDEISIIQESRDDDCVYYFYGRECIDCDSLDGYFISLKTKFPSLNLNEFEVYHDFHNYEQLQKYFNAYKVDQDEQFVPVVFVKGSYFIGKESITSLLEDWIKDNDAFECPSITDKSIGIISGGSPHYVLNLLTFSKVTSEAFKNRFHPGTMALLILLLAILCLTKDHKMVLKRGFSYIAGSYLAFVLFGMGFFSFFYNPSLYYLFYKVVGLLAVIFGLVGLNYFLKISEGIVNHKFKSLRRTALIFTKFLLFPFGLFVLGFLLSLFTFTGVSDLFYLMRDLYVGGFMKYSVLPLILYYCLILFLLPIGIVLFFNYLHGHTYLIHDERKHQEEQFQIDKKHGKKDSALKHSLRVLNALGRVIILVVGLVLLFWS
ncbi:MAG: hypothetical protein KKA62_03750 [Nanoarchaeota archaeon]|nr:hypothetical protein [Nanoarchaeota archaeon]MBU1644159.1 hypothetical protein [Nanoarchaeota archaeon]MBU1977039.1 hypothetical protein [Nanoarchaeota archaeon]